MNLDIYKQALTSRMAQIVAKLLTVAGTYAATRWGFDFTVKDPVAFIAGVSVFVTFGWDLIVHRIKHGVWLVHKPGEKCSDEDDDIGIAEEVK